MWAVDGVLEHRERSLDTREFLSKVFLFGAGPVSPVGADVPVGVDECCDLGEREAGDLEEIDERDLLEDIVGVDALAAGAADRFDQPASFVEAERRRREAGACGDVRDVQFGH